MNSDEPLPPLDYQTPTSPPVHTSSTFLGIGYLITPAIAFELAAAGLLSEKFFYLGLCLFPLALSWLIVASIKLSKIVRR